MFQRKSQVGTECWGRKRPSARELTNGCGWSTGGREVQYK